MKQNSLQNMKKYPDDIALHTADLTGAENSILVSLSNFTTEVTSNDFTLDRIYVYGDKSELESPNASWASSLWTSIRTLPIHLHLQNTQQVYLTKIRIQLLSGLTELLLT